MASVKTTRFKHFSCSRKRRFMDFSCKRAARFGAGRYPVNRKIKIVDLRA